MKITLLAFILLIPGWNILHAQAADSVRKLNKKTPVPQVQTGIASFYHSRFNGRPTASGELYDEKKMTAAHNRLPMGTKIRVTNLRNKRSIVVRVNDRLHHRNTRLVDLSKAAASYLGFLGRGIAKVRVEVLKD